MSEIFESIFNLKLIYIFEIRDCVLDFYFNR